MGIDPRRRTVLTVGAAFVSLPIAGCIGGAGGNVVSSDGLTLTSLDVAGSPGGSVALRPPNRVVLLDFFATWCAPCKPEMKNIRAARDRFPLDEVFIVSITQETDARAIKDFWREYQGTWPVAVDRDLEATRKYDVTGIPTIIVIAPDGTRTMRHTGLAGLEKIIAGIERARREADMA